MGKSATATAIEAATTPPPEAPRQPPVLSPKSVTLDHVGAVLRQFVVRLPADFVASDIGEPSIWSRVQSDRSAALRKLDHVTMIAHDEAMVWTCFVAEAGHDFAVLSAPQRSELRPRRNSYFSDDNYHVAWTGSGYSVVRKADGMVMKSGLANETLATRELQNLYPRPVG
jgi:hypothetical protein